MKFGHVAILTFFYRWKNLSKIEYIKYGNLIIDNMQMKQYEQGNLEFIRTDSKFNRATKSKQRFLFNGEYYSSEYLAVEYFKSQGYDAFFSENTTWKNLLRVLFKDIFKKFERLGRKKHYKRNFYDGEFFETYEKEIIDRFNYLKTLNLEDEVSRHSMKEWIKYRILKICNIMDDKQILAILYDEIQDYAHNHVGFPDLFVFNEDRFFFCEVKANNDVLKPVQVRKHEVLLNNGIDVCVFGINKDSSWIIEEKEKYFNEDYIDEENFMEIYDHKIRIANRTFDKFKNDQIEDMKRDFLSKYDLDTFIGFLNVISKEGQIKIDDSIIIKSIKEGNRIKNLRFLSRGMHFEERGLYSDAIDEYLQVETFERFERLNECYRRKKDGESQVNLIYHVLNHVDDIPYEIRNDFKRKADRLFRNKRSITTYDTDEICPICGSKVKLTTLHKRNNVSIFTCTNDACYWYGGTYRGSLKEFSKSNVK